MYRDLLAGGGRNGGPLSRRTVDYVHAILRKAFNDAVRSEQILPSNPAERAKRPRLERRDRLHDLWSAEQLRTFLETAADHRLFAFYRLAAYTGARRGELLNLRWADVDWKAPAIRIRGSVGMVDGERVEGTTKGGRERTVSLDAGTVAVLKAHRLRQMADQEVAGEAWTNTGHVFTTGFGVPIYPDTVTQVFTKLIRAHNEPAIPGARGRARQPLPAPENLLLPARLHDLRHCHATMLLLSGVPVHVVADRLGHADPAVTLRVYAHVIREHTKDVADRFAAAVDGGSETPGQDDDDGPEASALVPC
jgi:integrase